ncbi:uncharacterized protein LOC128884267 isoform X2 [Hylaeus volcanicus]|uniref:uncharacterized protein LOC128884267 isoform X2 n=1 Tax=Hylaeus volcanicus TaxID=313075 RepID=UPI0023B8467F|nr:uncharacterized protein LOC128884267 isoform X2 [Hylaeus volcanicus]
MDKTNTLQLDSIQSNASRILIKKDTLVTDPNTSRENGLQPVSKDLHTTDTLPMLKNDTLVPMLEEKNGLAQTMQIHDDVFQEPPKLENQKKKNADVPIKTIENSLDRESSDDVKINVLTNMMLAWSLAVHRVENGLKMNQHFENFFKDIVKHEEASCRSLKNLCLNFTALAEKENKNWLDTVVVLSRNMLHRSEQAHDLAKNIQQDVLDSTLSLTNRNNGRALQQIVAHCTLLDTELRTILKQYSEIHNTFLKTKESIQLLSTKFQVLRYKCRQNPFDRINLATRLLKRIQEFYSLEKSLERHREASKQAKYEYEIRMRHILNSLRDIEVKRNSSLKDAIGKYMVYQTSTLRNMQYDMDVTIQSITQIPQNNVLEGLLESTVQEKENQEMSKNSHKTVNSLTNVKLDACGTQTSNVPHLPNSNNFHTLLQNATQIENDIDAISLLNPIEKVSRVACDFLKNNPLNVALQTAVNHLSSSSMSNKFYPYTFHTLEDPLSITNEDLTKINHTIKTMEAQTLSIKPDFLTPIATRLELCDHYHQLFERIWNAHTQEDFHSIYENVDQFKNVAFYPSHRQAFVNELSNFYLTERYLLPSSESLSLLGVLTNILLSICDHHWDLDTARALMILCQVFYTKSSFNHETELKILATHCGNSQLSQTITKTPTKPFNLKTHEEKLNVPVSFNLTSEDDPLNEMFEKRVEESFRIQPIDKKNTTIYLYSLVYKSNIWNRARWIEENNKTFINDTEPNRILKQPSHDSDESILCDTNDTQPFTYRFPPLSMLLQLQQNFGVCMLLYGILESHVINLIENVEKVLNLPSHFTKSLLESVETYNQRLSQADSPCKFPPFAPQTSWHIN